jgi:hypothetical protein
MTPPEVSDGQSNASRVSILARIVPAFSYALPAIGAALSAILFIGVMGAMRNAESAGIAAVAGGMSKADLTTLITLYLAIVVGFAGIVVAVIRTQVMTTTASPSGWFYLIAAVLGFVPVARLWQAESLLIEVLTSRGPGVVTVASRIDLLLTLTPIAATVSVLTLLAASVLPLPSAFRAKRNYAPLLVLVLMELALIGMAVAFQIRISWFHQVMLTERL